MTLKAIFQSTLAMLVLVAAAAAKDLPDAPSSLMSSSIAAEPAVALVSATGRLPQDAEAPKTKIVDVKFLSLAVVSTGSTFADSYTTLFARENWLAHKQGVCNAEVESAYLYGTHPTVGRAYGVAAAKSVGSVAAAYFLRKHHSRIWGLPLIANTAVGLQGVTQNMMACN